MIGQTLPAWMDHAACAAPAARALPWTTDSRDVPAVLVELMRETCDGCPVRLACAGYARASKISGGWWAGVDRDPEAGLVVEVEPAQVEPVHVEPEPLPRAVPVYARDGELIDHQLVLFPWTRAVGGAA